MSGIYTQTRRVDFTPRGKYWVSPNWSGSDEWVMPPIPGTQTTTSFRSGALGDLLEQETPDDRFLGRGSAHATGLSGPTDTGHDFYSRKQWYFSTSHPDFRLDSTRNLIPGYTRHFRGPLIADLQPWSRYVYPAIERLSSVSATPEMQQLYRKAIPTQSEAGASTALAELLGEGFSSLLPSIRDPRDFRSVLRPKKDPQISYKGVDPTDVGKADLYTEFGVLPVIRDVQKVVRSLKKANAIIRQYERDSGRRVRRRVNLPAVTSISEDYTAPYSPNWGVSLDNFGWTRSGPVTLTSTKRTEWWFSGAFTYFVETDSSVLNELERFEQLGNKLLGTRLTVDVLWNLAPWSWLIDWFSTVGDSLSNVVAFQNDGLVMPYGYAMRKTTVTTVAASMLVDRSAPEKEILTYRNTFKVVQKERVKATPYGFGLDLGSLNPRQWAILASLGLTRAPQRL